LLDEPASFLDRVSDERLVETLRSLRGKTTIILVSHRPSHLAVADRVLHLGDGRLLRETAPEQFAPRNNELTA
jgi:ATP-binding cassette subfamily C protein/ATP-binding cassette subfamily C protein LapB